MAYNTPETVADYLARFQMEITHRGKGTFTPDHVKYSLTIASGGKDFFTTFESNPHVHGEPTITQVFGALASDAMVVRDYATTTRRCRKDSSPSRNCKKTSTSGTSVTKSTISTATLPSPSRTVPTQMWTLRTTTSSHGFPTMPSGWKKPSSMGFSKAVRAISTK